MKERWRLWHTIDDSRVGSIGEIVSPSAPPEGGRSEKSGDGYWLTVYGPAADSQHREPIVEIYVLVPEFRKR